MTPEETEYRRQVAKEVKSLKQRVTQAEENIWTLNDHIGKANKLIKQQNDAIAGLNELWEQRVGKLRAQVEKLQGTHGR